MNTYGLSTLLKEASMEGAVMTAAPHRNWFQRNISDPVSKRVGNSFNVMKDNLYRNIYRMGLGSDEWYARHLDSELPKLYSQIPYPTQSFEEFDDARRFGDPTGTDRGDVYEHYASSVQGPLSTGWVGRALNASQPIPEEMELDSALFPWQDYYVNNREKGAVPGVAAALDYGSYFVPYVGPAQLGREFIQQAGDGNYVQAGLYAGIPLLHGAAGLIPKYGRNIQSAATKVLGGLMGTGAAATVPLDMLRNRVYEQKPSQLMGHLDDDDLQDATQIHRNIGGSEIF